MAGFQPISALSLENINVIWTADLAGTTIDPTGVSTSTTALVVQFAFPVSSGNPLLPAQPVTWYQGNWVLGTTIRGYVAQCPVGPGGVVTFTPGQKYDVWSQVQGSPEQPEKYVGTQAVY